MPVNIVLASIDCVRVDALRHRFFEKKQAIGSYYDTCITQASFTSPSHTSMLSGLYPFNHGVRWLVNYETNSQLLQEILSENGFNTAAFIGGFPLPTGNISKGFDLYDDVNTITDEWEGRQEFGPANILVNRAVDWLKDHQGEDNFVFLHFFDLHFTFRSEFGKRDPPDFDDQHVYENVEQYIGRQQQRYYDEADEIGRQLELLDDLIEIDTFVITGDHGSKMPYEHGYPWVYNQEGDRVGSHFRGADVYDNTVRVPLILDGDAFSDKTVHKQVRSIDIVPTLLDALDLEIPDVDGHSLLANESSDRAYSETYHGQLTKENKFARDMNDRYEFGWSDLDSLVSLRTDDWKLICTANEQLEPVELYHIAQDPAESRNLIDDELEKADELFGELSELLEEDDQWAQTGETVSESVQDRLDDLGYL
ncbi:sulfatase [Halorutilales archaeon Cl-col2-1]